MDFIINTARTISRKFILGEDSYANKELVKLSKLLLETPELHNNATIQELINKMVQAHEHKNYLYIADLIEYELLLILLETYPTKPLH